MHLSQATDYICLHSISKDSIYINGDFKHRSVFWKVVYPASEIILLSNNICLEVLFNLKILVN